MAVLGLLTVATVGVDVLAASLGAGRLGASRAAIVGAVAGTILGLFAGLPGLLLGPFLGAVAGEYWTRVTSIRPAVSVWARGSAWR